MSPNVLKAGSFVELFPTISASPAPLQRSRAAQLEEELERVRRTTEETISLETSRIREEVRSEALEETLQAARAMRAAARELSQAAARGIQTAQADVVAIAVAIAAKIVRREIAQENDFAAKLARRCLQRIANQSEVRIRVHPADHERVLAEREALLREAGLGHEITVWADQRVDRGGCIVETPDFVVDGTIKSQLEGARAALTGGAR
jgi:flagellar assembly protein FliH